MVEANIEEAKARLRVRARTQRAEIAAAVRTGAAHAAANAFLDGVPLAPTDIVAFYWPIHEELDCKPVAADDLAAAAEPAEALLFSVQ